MHRTQRAGGLARFQVSGELRQPGGFGRGGLVAGLGGLLLAAETVLHHLEVGEDQLQVDGFDVADGVDAFGLVDILDNVDDVVVVKAAHDMHDGVAFADVAEELVAEPRALRRALDQPRDVDKFDRGGRFFVGLPDFGQLVEPGVRHGDDPGVRLDGAERIVGRLGVAGGGDGVEKGGFAHVGQAHDA